MKKVILILSGGLDSTTLLYFLINKGYEVSALSFDYGQKHKKELDYAKNTCKKLSTEHKIVDLTSLNQLLDSALTREDKSIPEGHYADEVMKQTVVPNRNMIMLSIAVGWAVSLEAEKVCFAAHSGDHDIYPDCRPEFVEKLNEVTKISNYIPVEIYAPFLGLDKGDIAVLGKDLGVNFEETWTCYVGSEKPCGKCGACVEREEALNKIK